MISRFRDRATRLEWRHRIEDHDGDVGTEGGIERWLKLTEGLGLDSAYVESTEGILPATRFAVEAYVHFVRDKSPLEAIASSLTELFAPNLHEERISGMLAHYDFVNPDIMSYFSRRLTAGAARRRLRARIRQGPTPGRRRNARRSATRCCSRPMCYGFSSTRCIMPMSRATFRRARLCPRKRRGKLEKRSRWRRMASRNISVSEASRPVLPRHAKLKFDETRQVWVILAPERVLAPDEIAVEVLQLCDGVRNVAADGRSARRKIRRRARRDRNRRHCHAAGPCRQGIFDRSAREDVMSPTLTDAHLVASDPTDGLAVLENRGSTAETFGIPLAVLAELTHRCPLQCPYCSNPVELDRGGSRAFDRGMEEGALRARRNRRAADPFLRRRADRAQGSGRTGAARQRRRALFQSDHLGRAGDPRKTRCARRCRAVPRADQFSGQRACRGRPRRRLQGRPRQEDRSGKMDARAGAAADGQCGDAPAKPVPAARHHPDGGRSRRRPAGSRQCAILRLGAEEPRRADADARPARGNQPPSSRKRASG